MDDKKYSWLMRTDGTTAEKKLRLKLLEEESIKINAYSKKLELEMTDPNHPNFCCHWPLLAKANKLRLN